MFVDIVGALFEDLLQFVPLAMLCQSLQHQNMPSLHAGDVHVTSARIWRAGLGSWGMRMRCGRTWVPAGARACSG